MHCEPCIASKIEQGQSPGARALDQVTVEVSKKDDALAQRFPSEQGIAKPRQVHLSARAEVHRGNHKVDLALSTVCLLSGACSESSADLTPAELGLLGWDGGHGRALGNHCDSRGHPDAGAAAMHASSPRPLCIHSCPASRKCCSVTSGLCPASNINLLIRQKLEELRVLASQAVGVQEADVEADMVGCCVRC